MATTHKPNIGADDPRGVWTSEFWLTALCIVGVVVLLVTGTITVEELQQLWPLAGLAGVYTGGRAWLKGRRRGY